MEASAASGTTTVSINSYANPSLSQFVSGTFVGFNFWVVSGTSGTAGSENPVTGYSYNAGTGIGTVTLGGGGLTAAVDNTSQVTFDGPQRWGAIRAAQGDTVQLAANADPVAGNTVGLSGTPFYVKMISGAASGEEHQITAYDGTTQTATLDASWIVTPSAGDLAIVRRVGFSYITGEYNGSTSRGYQSNFEFYGGSGCWIDNGTKHGMLLGASGLSAKRPTTALSPTPKPSSTSSSASIPRSWPRSPRVRFSPTRSIQAGTGITSGRNTPTPSRRWNLAWSMTLP